MNKQNQSLTDFLQTMPLSSFVIQRSPISNKEAQTLYDIWAYGEQNEYGKKIIPDKVDSFTVASLTNKGYICKEPTIHTGSNSENFCMFTDRGKDVIRKIILHKERSSFEKSSNTIDYELIHRIDQKLKTKTASINNINNNWLGRLLKSGN